MSLSKSADKAIIIFFLSLTLTAIFFSECLSVIPYTERDYISESQRRKDGVVAYPGMEFTLSMHDRRFFDQIAFEMSKQRALLVEIKPLEKPAGVMLMATRPVGLRQYKEIWRDDDVKDVVRFWTDTYFIPSEPCNPNACPKIAFVSTRGQISLTILEIKTQAFQRW
ncbi:MAG: hypothetical protein V2B19_18555 [Pseudomonadota bacterium]